jgi:hypothetical protein
MSHCPPHPSLPLGSFIPRTTTPAAAGVVVVVGGEIVEDFSSRLFIHLLDVHRIKGGVEESHFVVTLSPSFYSKRIAFPFIRKPRYFALAK